MIISVSGQLASGKDCMADYLVKSLNSIGRPGPQCGDWSRTAFASGTWSRTAFANAVKEIYQTSFNVDRDFVEKWKRIPEAPPGMLMNVRKSLQFIGDGFRQIKGDIWIDIALRPHDKCRNICLSDGRYLNEGYAVKAKGGVNIVMWRPGFENDDPNASESQIRTIVDYCVKTKQDGPIQVGVKGERHPDHDQIPFLEYYDYFMINDGSVEDLYAKIDMKLIPWLQTI